MLRAMLCTCALGLPLTAAAFTGTDLVKLCNRTDVPSKSACQAYIEGAADGAYNTIEAIGGTTGPRVGQYFCLPTGTTPDEMTNAVRHWANDNGDKLEYNASTVVALGLGATYACKVSN
jgi:hypothetical protein